MDRTPIRPWQGPARDVPGGPDTGTASALSRAVFDAMPAMVFVVDEDVRIEEYNLAARALLGGDRSVVLRRRAGEVLHCLHEADVPEGCGRGPNCRHCTVRNAVGEAFHGGSVVRRRAKLELERDGRRVQIYALITASPFEYEGVRRVVLVVEDISELAELQRIIPICCRCKKVRDDRESWTRVEAYFKDRWDLDFTHGFCPECERREMKAIDATLGD